MKAAPELGRLDANFAIEFGCQELGERALALLFEAESGGSYDGFRVSFPEEKDYQRDVKFQLTRDDAKNPASLFIGHRYDGEVTLVSSVSYPAETWDTEYTRKHFCRISGNIAVAAELAGMPMDLQRLPVEEIVYVRDYWQRVLEEVKPDEPVASKPLSIKQYFHSWLAADFDFSRLVYQR